MDERTFRDAMGKFTTGVTIITTVVGEEVHGMTANAFMSVSINPKLITVSIDQKAHMHEKIRKASKFAVSVLKQDQVEASMHFAGQKEVKGIEFNWFKGIPVIKNSLANIVCEVYDSFKAGDHTLYIGKVIELSMEDGDPLVFYEGKYGKGKTGQSGIA